MSTNIGTLTAILGVDATQLDKAGTAMSSLSQKFRTFGYLATAALTVPMVAAGKASFNMAKEFEYSIQKIVGLTGVAQDTVNAWERDLLAMAPEVAKGPRELAEALYFISSSGIKGADAMDVLKLSAKAATAGLGETQAVANVLTSALNAYRGTGLTAAYATDTLVAAVREGKAEAPGFATALGQIIPIAAQMGVSFDQVAGGMAAITLTGASAANAAVYLKGVFNSLLTASKQGEDALKLMGSSYAELRSILANQGLIALMQKLRDLQVKYGDELLSDVLPNIRALTGYLSLAGKNFQYNTELMKRVTESTGSLGKAFEAVAQTIKVRYDSAISTAQISLISLGKSIAEGFLPIMEKWIKKLGELTAWFNGLSESERQNKLVMLAWVAAAGPIALFISLLGYALSGLISTVKLVIGVFRLLGLAMMTNPVLALITVILAAANAFMIFANKGKKAVDTQIALNKAMEASDAVRGDNQSIIDRMGLFSQLDQRQLENLKSDIDTRIALEKDFRIKLLAEAQKGIKDDKFILDQKKIIANAEQDIYNWERNREAKTYRGPIIKDLKTQIDTANRAINEYKANLKNIQEFDLETTQANIKLFEGYGSRITVALGKTSDAIKTETIDYKKLQEETTRLHKLFLEQYDVQLKKQNEEIDRKKLIIKLNKDLRDHETNYSSFPTRFLAFPIDTPSGPTKLEDEYAKGLISYKTYLDQKFQMDLLNAGNSADARMQVETKYFKDLQALRDNDTQAYLQATANAISVISSLIEAGKQRELSAVGQNAAAREKIERNYFEKQKRWAIAQALVNGALAITNMIANVPLSVLNPATWVGIGIAAASTAAQIAIIAGQGMKEGGVVPPGFPNDTFPARLTSGETVLPANFNGAALQGMSGEVVFTIAGTTLVGVLKNQNRKMGSYS